MFLHDTQTVEIPTIPAVNSAAMKTSKTVEAEWGDIPAAIEDTLRSWGPMTGHEMGEFLDIPVNIINKTLRRMRQPSKRRKPLGERRVHITGWAPEAEGQRPYPRPIYQLGHGDNKRRPPKKHRNAVVRDYYQAKKAKTRMNFVFNLGATIR